MFLGANTYMADLRFYRPERYVTEPEAIEPVRAAAARDMDRDFGIVAALLDPGPWLLGDTFSAVDLYFAMIASWAGDVPALFRAHPEIEAHYGRVAARPAVGNVWRRHGFPSVS